MSVVIATLAAIIAAVSATAGIRHFTVRRPAAAPSGSDAPDRRRRHLPNLARTPRVVDPASLAAWADDLARSLRHGSTLHAALVEVTPIDPVIRDRSQSLRHWLDRGATVADACDEWSSDLDVDGPRRGHERRDRRELLATMAAVLAAAATLGGPAARPLDRFAAAMRQRATDDMERAAQSAQARMSANVMTAVPLAVLALLVLTDADVRAVITSLSGGSAVAAGLVLNVAGAAWMRRIVSGTGASPC